MSKKSSKIPGGLLLNNGAPTTNATRLPSVVKKRHSVTLEVNKSAGPFAGLLKQEFKPKIKSRTTSKKDREEFLAEEERRMKHEQVKNSARQTIVKKEEDKKKKDDERKKARLADSSIKQQDIVTFGVGNSKSSGNKGYLMNGRVTVKEEISDDLPTFSRKITSASRRITDDDEDVGDGVDVKTCLSQLYVDDFIHGKRRDVFSSTGPVKLPLVSWTVQRKRRRRKRMKVSAKPHNILGKKLTIGQNTFSDKHVVRYRQDDIQSPSIPTWEDLKKVGVFDCIDPSKPYISPVSSGLLAAKRKTNSTVMKPTSTVASALLKQFLHPARSDIVLMKVPPLPIMPSCSGTIKTEVSKESDSSSPLTFRDLLNAVGKNGGPVGKLQICKSGRAFLRVNNIKMELAFASNTGNIIDLVKMDMGKLKSQEVENSTDIMGNADCVGNAGFQFILAPHWESIHSDT